MRVLLANILALEHAVLSNSATSALIVACKALDLSCGDVLWTSPNSFVASANCALHCGARIDFVDIDPKTYNMCPVKLEEKLSKAKINGSLPKIVIPVHISGQSCDMHAIKRLADKYGFYIIEDASHAIGGKYYDKAIGCCEFSDIAIFSFHPVKIITTAEGGAAMTNSKVLADKMKLFVNHGITRDRELMSCEPHGTWYYQQNELGFNFRMPDLLAALGESQLSKIDCFVEARHELAQRYGECLKDLPVTLPELIDNVYSSNHLYILRLHLKDIKSSKTEIFDSLRDFGVGVNVHYIPIHSQPYYQKLGFKEGDFPAAEHYYREALSIPMFHHMTIEQQDIVISSLRKVLI